MGAWERQRGGGAKPFLFPLPLPSPTSSTHGNGVSNPVTRVGGASSRVKHASATCAHTSAPKPLVSGASCETSRRPVLLTDASTVELTR